VDVGARAVLERLAGAPLARRITGAWMRRFARRRAAKLDQVAAGPIQERMLLRLVRHARETHFGREHGFGRVRSVADYQQRVPLRTYEDFWRDWWKAAFPVLGGVTWPGHIPYVALSSGTTSGTTKYIPVSQAMLASNRRGALTTLALFLAAHPDVDLFSGRLFMLGGSTSLEDLTSRVGPKPGTSAHVLGPAHRRVLAGDLSGIVAREIPAVLRPYAFPPLHLALLTDWDEKLRLLAAQGANLPVTMISGVPSWLLALFDRLRRATGRQHVAEVWPQLRLIVHGGTGFEPYRKLFRDIVGSPSVHFVECYPASEGYVATEDPGTELLRLIPDHGVFFEFVPAGELSAARPTRHTAADLELGVQYAVVMTTSAGLWSYVLGDTVNFERRRPPLLRFAGRTQQFLSAFGEHLIGEEVERSVTRAADAAGLAVVDYHAGPVFAARAGVPGRHRFVVEFATPPPTGAVERFARQLDSELCQLNEDYRAHRCGDVTLLGPEVWAVPPGGFAAWMRHRGRVGGQHKVPRLDNSGSLTRELTRFFAAPTGTNC
jgi:hypothetical protein